MSDLDKINPPIILEESGSLHPINQTKDYLLKLLAGLGFKEVHGPEIETEEFNFDMLNIKKSHPARQMPLCGQIRAHGQLQKLRIELVRNLLSQYYAVLLKPTTQ